MKIFLEIDPAAAAPIWRQIEDGMRMLVASGRLPVGASVPSVRELSRSLRVNPATISKAYRLLTESGLLVVRRGEGTFVGELSPQALAAERGRLLEEGARRFAEVARAIGANRKEASRAFEVMWKETTGGGEGKDR